MESQIAAATASASPSIAENALKDGEDVGASADLPRQPSSQNPTLAETRLQSPDAGDGELDEHLSATKAERDSKKREIKLWIKQFEEREGRSPTAE